MRRTVTVTRDIKLEVECNVYGVRRPGRILLGLRTPGIKRRFWWGEAAEEAFWDWKETK